MPEPRVSLEVEDADHDLPLGVVAGQGEGPGVGQHGSPGHADPQYTPVLSEERKPLIIRTVRRGGDVVTCWVVYST